MVCARPMAMPETGCRYHNVSDWDTMKYRLAEIAKDVEPIQPGEVGVWYDNAGGYCDVVVWADGGSRYVETESSHILAAVNPDGTLCGFRVIRTDLLGNDAGGMAHARLKVKMAVTAG